MKLVVLDADREILTIEDVAAILGLHEQTIAAMAQCGELPAFQVWGQWRIRRKDFDKWMADESAVDVPPSEDG